MTAMNIRSTFCFFLLALAACMLVPAAAQANSLSVSFALANLPQTITLCRVPTAIGVFGFDERWQVAIDVDDNAATGDPNTGIEVLLAASTLPQSTPCAPTSATTQQSIVASMYAWDQAQQTFVQNSQVVNLSLDFTAKTLSMSTSVSGPLDAFSALSRMYFFAQASYLPSNGNPNLTYDVAESIHVGASVVDPPNDVQVCESPCSSGASWYPLIDLVGVSATTTDALPAFGENTVYLEFQMASLSEIVGLCLYPGQFANPASEWGWYVWSNVDNNLATGDPSAGLDLVVSVSTQAPLPGCTPYSANLEQSLSIELYRYDSTLGDYVAVPIGTWPVTVDTSSGKIIVQADRSIAPLSSLSAPSLFYMQTFRLYWPYPTQPDNPYATDVLSGISLGRTFVDAVGDVQNCSLGCSTSASWYPMIDLVGASVHLQDKIFRNEFE